MQIQAKHKYLTKKLLPETEQQNFFKNHGKCWLIN